DLSHTFSRTDDLQKDPDIESLDDYFTTFDKVVFVDTANPKVLIAAYKNIPQEMPALMIDHHKQDESFAREGDLIKIIRKSGAGASIMVDYFRQRGYDLSADEMHRIRKVAYIGIKTDTGNFDEDKMTLLDKSSLDHLVDALNQNKEEIERDKEYGAVDNEEEHDWDVIERIEDVTITDKVRKGYGSILAGMERLPNKLLFSALPSVTDDASSIAYYADRLFYKEDWNEENRPSATVVCGLVKGFEDDKEIYDLVVSGRSEGFRMDLADIFRNTFYLETKEGKKMVFGGGRKTKAGSYVTGGRVPLSRDGLFMGEERADEMVAPNAKNELANSKVLKVIASFKSRIMQQLGPKHE
ncbi:MAG: DHH family phosphoesterase, partial [Nanoarchaeota archaeon]